MRPFFCALFVQLSGARSSPPQSVPSRLFTRGALTTSEGNQMASVQVTFSEGTSDTWTTLTDDQTQKVCEFITTLAGPSNEARTGWSHPVSPEHPRWVNAYSVTRQSGGPEEGGWWYDVGTFEHGIRCETEAEVDAAEETLSVQFPRTKRRYNVAGGPDHDVKVEDHPGKDFPEETPRYE